MTTLANLPMGGDVQIYALQLEFAINAVSYTHLTLPTNREV